MALKPGTIKALFGKLATNADDIVQYGDDVLDVTKPYLDDVYEDTSKLLDYYNSKIKWGEGRVPHRYVESPILQNALGSKTLYDQGIPVLTDADSGVLQKATDYLLYGKGALPVGDKRSNIVDSLSRAVDAAPAVRPSSNWTTDYLGDVNLDYGIMGNFIGTSPKYFGKSVEVPSLPVNSLVVDNVDMLDDGNIRETLRPHKNTALGRWYKNKMASSGQPSSFSEFLEKIYKPSYTSFDSVIDDSDLPF